MEVVSRLRLSGAVLLVLGVLGCGGDEGTADRGRERAAMRQDAEARSAAVPALCGAPLRAGLAGRVVGAGPVELSGLVHSRTQSQVLWTHNDSGDRARVFAIARNGGLLGDIAVAGADNLDWEDIAIGPSAGARNALYIGDIGDNLAMRPTVTVYRVPEPRLGAGVPPATAPADRLVLRYPDGPHDAEALLVDPAGGALVIVTKALGGRAGVYVGRPRSPRATTRMRRAAVVSLGVGEPVTAGDLSADGTTIVLRSYGRAFVWSRHRGESIPAALSRRPCTAQAGLLAEGQGEALALTGDGRAFYTVAEGIRPALRRYAPG